MPTEAERHCPHCEAERTFWRVAETELHLGDKTKWRCSECERQVVLVDGVVDTGA